jgi:hypothetical protein
LSLVLALSINNKQKKNFSKNKTGQDSGGKRWVGEREFKGKTLLTLPPL